MNQSLIFVGSNANMSQMTDLARLQGYTNLTIIDHDYYGNTDAIEGIPVIGSEQSHRWSSQNDYFMAVSWFPEKTDLQKRNKQKRQRLIELLAQEKITCVNLLHPTAIIPGTVILGQGLMICAGAIIGNHSVINNFVQIREHAYLAHHATIGHGSIIQVYGYVGSHISLGPDCYVGIRASCVQQHSHISDHSFIKSHELYKG